MKRRILAFVGLAFAVAGFIMIPVSLFCGINYLVPIGLVFAAFLILTLVKKMPSDIEASEASEGEDKEGGNE
ncbi:MAG: hypothetical protein IKX58_08940 [Clostridia bacterium]|nr:hypothetical protein [Clostridia bacterium]